MQFLRTSSITAFGSWPSSNSTIIFSIRSGSNWFGYKMFTNKWLWMTIFVVFALTLAALLVPGFQELLRLSSLDGQQWLYVAGLPLAVLALSELTKFFTRNIKN